MKPVKKLVKELTDKTGPYSIKVKVIDKTNVQTSPTHKGLLYQRITFADEENGQEFDVKSILGRILESASHERNYSSAMDIVQTKVGLILGGKKYLLVLDDVWNEDREKWLELRKFLMGSSIKTTLYNEEIEAYEDVIQNRMEYEISNAKLKLTPDKYRTDPNDHLYQLYFTNKTIIMPVAGANLPSGPEYMSLTSIPRAITIDARYDVLAIVIYVEPTRQVPRQSGQPLAVREVVVIDHSSEQTMVLTAWSDLATRDCEALHNIVASFPVVGFTTLRPSYHKGFSLSTTNSTFVILDPAGEKVDALRAWGRENKKLLVAKNHQVSEVRRPETERIITTVKQLREKKVNNTLQEERHWLYVTLTEFDRKDVRFYLGCSNCGTRGNEDMGVEYACTTCMEEKVISSPRMNMTFEAEDATGSYTLTAFTNDAEKLLQVQAPALYSMPNQEKDDYLIRIEAKLRTTPVYIQVGPATALSRNRVLKWVLKQVSLN